MSVKIKILSLGVILAASALFFSFTFYNFNQSFNLTSLVWLLISTVLFLALFILQSVIIKNFYFMGGICFAESTAMIIPFYKQFSLLLLTNVILVFIILFVAAWGNRNYLKNVLKINFLIIGGRFAMRAFTALILFGVIIYISSVTFQSLVDSIVKSSLPLTQNIIGQFVPAAPQSTYSEVQNFISSQLTGLPENIKKLILVGFAALIFFSVRTGFILINWVVVFLSFIIYKILLATNFINITPEPRIKDVISL